MSILAKSPYGHEVRGRRKLGNHGAFEKFLEELKTILEEDTAAGKAAVVSDLDLSQNHLSLEQFESVFSLLAISGAAVRRFRLFGCPTLNDEVVRLFADFFRADLTADRAPKEIHLSDCAITTEGFQQLMLALEECDLYPLTNSKTGSAEALYLRLENNYIEESAIQQKVEEGVIAPLQKHRGARMPPAEGGVKIHLVANNSGGFQQHAGEPPAPEDAPAPKEVKEWGKDKKQQERGKGSQPQWPAWQPQQRRQPWQLSAQAVAPPKPTTLLRPSTKAVRPSVIGAAPTADRSRSPAAAKWVQTGAALSRPQAYRPPQVQARPQQQQARPQQQARQAWQAQPRQPVQPKGPPPSKAVPPGWEEVWCEEHQMNYFWNSITEESLWERPVK